MKTERITVMDSEGDAITISFGTVITWIDCEKTCLAFDKYDNLLELAHAIIDNTPPPPLNHQKIKG